MSNCFTLLCAFLAICVIAEDSLVCALILNREKNSWCEDFDQDRPAVKCRNCLTEEECLATDSDECSWHMDSCSYHNTEVAIWIGVIGGVYFGLMICVCCSKKCCCTGRAEAMKVKY